MIGRWALAREIAENRNGDSVDITAVAEPRERADGVAPLATASIGSASQRQLVVDLASTIQSSPSVLQHARNIATAIVDGQANHCAATLSALLVFVGIFPNGGGTGKGDLEPRVLSLAYDLEHRRGWSRIALGNKLIPGDVGVVITDSGVHHIYLILDATDQAAPIIADNQLSGIHPRSLAGDPKQDFSPTSYILRAPELPIA